MLITAAHLARIYRWSLFINVYENPPLKRLIQASSIGYMLNYIVPFKLGDIVRAWYASRKMRNGKTLALSTVIVDRFFDILIVGIIFTALSLGQGSRGGADDIYGTAVFYVKTAAIIYGTVVLIYAFRTYVKKIIALLARVFNERIENSILKFSFALISNFKDIFKKINPVRLMVSTVGMWVLYISSYYTFSIFLTAVEGQGVTWMDVFTMLFSQESIMLSTGKSSLFWQDQRIPLHPYYMLIYTMIPLAALVGISVIIKDRNDYKSGNPHYINLLPHMDSSERLTFLENYFSDQNKEYIMNYLKINQDISIIRDYSAGSNATTMLCMDSEQTFFRKYAFGEDGDKLYQQVLWIEENSQQLRLPDILKQGKTDAYCFYDMPYDSHAVGLFEYVHSMPTEQSWQMIKNVLESLEISIYKIGERKADKETISRYVNDKVKRNLEKIKRAKRIIALQQYDTIIINGVEYNNLPYYKRFLCDSYLTEIFINDKYAVIHGDLTIENIICTRGNDGRDNFYIIDPNTGNIHDSPNLDYGKLLQSIHGGYEFLMAAKDVSVDGNHINFLFTQSSAYKELHGLLKSYMQERFGEERTKSIYFHEIIHWLRLMPYKIEKDGKRALLFYAGMLRVLHDVVEMYGDVNEV